MSRYVSVLFYVTFLFSCTYLLSYLSSVEVRESAHYSNKTNDLKKYELTNSNSNDDMTTSKSLIKNYE